MVNGCTSACQNQDSEVHNLAVQAALPALPISDWGKQTQCTFLETDEMTGEELAFIAESGALYCGELGWYAECGLLDVFKRYHKSKKTKNLSKQSIK